MSYRILVINPGSTSTKISIFDDEAEVVRVTLRHSEADLCRFATIADQYEYRENFVLKFLEDNKIDLDSINAVVGRGGVLKPMPGGTYIVSKAMCDYLKNPKQEHASNLGALIAKPIADKIDVTAFIVDPVVVDEMEPEARIAGHPAFERISIFHALNQKAVARSVAEKIGKKYEACNFIVAHLGGGVSVGAHRKGKVIDVNNALDGDGPFSAERSGGLPVGQLVEMCFSGKYTKQDMKKMVKGQGGVIAYLGTNNMMEVEKRIDNKDEKALAVFNAVCYQISKEIGACAAVLDGKVDRIIITGGVANDKRLVEYIKNKVSFIAPIEVVPGEEEMSALARGALRVLNKEEKAKEYN
ncbi:MAG: butyrate kinase [Proteobacteria bacterium]|nr:butyrate kinase [Pseudomonadota bacterium]